MSSKHARRYAIANIWGLEMVEQDGLVKLLSIINKTNKNRNDKNICINNEKNNTSQNFDLIIAKHLNKSRRNALANIFKF